MSKILVIEPHRIVQQAIAIALYPDNDVALMGAIPESLNVKGFDAVIVDAASLQEKNGLGEAGLRRVQDWKLPTIWIDGEAAAQAPGRETVVTLTKPISREALIGALGKCLGRSSVSKPDDATAGREERPSPAEEKAKEASPERAKFIELVEVVEADSGGKKTEQNKKS